MSRISVERPHQLGLAEARLRAQKLAERLASQYDVNYDWAGDSLKIKRTGVTGQIDVAADTVKVDLKLGLLLSALAGTIRKEIESTLDKALS